MVYHEIPRSNPQNVLGKSADCLQRVRRWSMVNQQNRLSGVHGWSAASLRIRKIPKYSYVKAALQRRDGLVQSQTYWLGCPHPLPVSLPQEIPLACRASCPKPDLQRTMVNKHVGILLHFMYESHNIRM